MKNIFEKKEVDELNGTKFFDNNWIISWQLALGREIHFLPSV